MLSLIFLFIYKLIAVYKDSEITKNHRLLKVITKISILTFSSISITFIHLIDSIIFLGVFSFDNTHFYKWIDSYITIFDVYTNCLCIIMCHIAFKSYYLFICKYMDNMCRTCWIFCIGVKPQNIELKASASSSASSSNGSTKPQKAVTADFCE